MNPCYRKLAIPISSCPTYHPPYMPLSRLQWAHPQAVSHQGNPWLSFQGAENQKPHLTNIYETYTRMWNYKNCFHPTWKLKHLLVMQQCPIPTKAHLCALPTIQVAIVGQTANMGTIIAVTQRLKRWYSYTSPNKWPTSTWSDRSAKRSHTNLSLFHSQNFLGPNHVMRHRAPWWTHEPTSLIEWTNNRTPVNTPTHALSNMELGKSARLVEQWLLTQGWHQLIQQLQTCSCITQHIGPIDQAQWSPSSKIRPSLASGMERPSSCTGLPPFGICPTSWLSPCQDAWHDPEELLDHAALPGSQTLLPTLHCSCMSHPTEEMSTPHHHWLYMEGPQPRISQHQPTWSNAIWVHLAMVVAMDHLCKSRLWTTANDQSGCSWWLLLHPTHIQWYSTTQCYPPEGSQRTTLDHLPIDTTHGLGKVPTIFLCFHWNSSRFVQCCPLHTYLPTAARASTWGTR